jgi:hypothetical protein
MLTWHEQALNLTHHVQSNIVFFGGGGEERGGLKKVLAVRHYMPVNYFHFCINELRAEKNGIHTDTNSLLAKSFKY